jgi:hypothetical protein
MLGHVVRGIAILGAVVALAGCGKGDDKGKTEGGKDKLDPAAECTKYFEANQKNGDKARFVDACKKDMALIACSGEAAGSGFCTKAMEDPAKKQIIDDMKAGLGQ